MNDQTSKAEHPTAQSGAGYVLGVEAAELQRLKRQQDTWAVETSEWVDRLQLQPGAAVVDAGCGPGFVVPELRERVGAQGRVIAIDGEERYLTELRQTAERQSWNNVQVEHGQLENFELSEAVDGVFARWMLTFPSDPGAIVARLASWLKPGGRAVLVDYNHEGISLYPRSEGFVRVVATMRKWFADRGGDAFVAGRIPGFLRAAGLEVESVDPVVRCGEPGSSIWAWAEEFFLFHSSAMEEQGLLSSAEREQFAKEWHERAQSPDARFYTPIQVGFTARRPLL